MTERIRHCCQEKTLCLLTPLLMRGSLPVKLLVVHPGPLMYTKNFSSFEAPGPGACGRSGTECGSCILPPGRYGG